MVLHYIGIFILGMYNTLHLLLILKIFFTGVVSYGDLAIGRTFTASSTCGLDGPKTFCSIELPDNSTEEDDGNGGRGCFICDSSDPANSHPASFLSDLDSSAMPLRTWWQAENGVGDVTLELELEALFFFTHLVASFRLPRPAAAVIERSRDFGVTYEPYQYYSNDCEGDFGMPDRSSVRTVDEVICTSAYSSLQPLTNGEVGGESFVAHTSTVAVYLRLQYA